MAGHHHHINPSAFPMRVSEAVAIIAGELAQGAPDAMITHASMLDNATNGAMCFAENTKSFARIADMAGVICLTNQDTQAFRAPRKNRLTGHQKSSGLAAIQPLIGWKLIMICGRQILVSG